MRQFIFLAVAVASTWGSAALAQWNGDCTTMGATQAFDRQGICVSSVLASQSGNSYGVASLVDDRDASAWCEGVAGPGKGEKITLEWANAAPLQRIWITNGYAKSAKSWRRNARVRDVAVRVKSRGQDVRVFETRLKDTAGEQQIRFPFAVNAPVRVVIRIKSVYPGSHYTDTCVSGLWPDFGF